MGLKKKSFIISICLAVFSLVATTLIIRQIVLVQFQKIEDQRVERNIRRIEAIIEDRFVQINNKLVDWTNWDDTYKYIDDKNKEYASSNLAEGTFEALGIDEVLFIDKNGSLVNSIEDIGFEEKMDDSTTVYDQYFATGSALLKIDKEIGYKKGLIKTNNGLLLFVTRNILKSGGLGTPNGSMVFGRYLNENILNSMKDLTQFDAGMYLWDDPNLPNDYKVAKDKYLSDGESQLVKILDSKIISGYLIIKDIDGKPQVIVRSDIQRDISIQGKNTIMVMIGLLGLGGILMIGFNYWLLDRIVLKKIFLLSRDVSNLGESKAFNSRLDESDKSIDEVDCLRKEINKMLSSWSMEKQKGESLLDLINAMVVILAANGEVLMVNKKGLEILGYKKEEVIGKDWFKNFIPKDTQERVKNIFNEIMKGNLEENAEIENEVVTSKNKKVLISWNNTVITDNNNKVVSTLSLGEDITVKKEEERKKEEYARELERLNEVMVDRELKMISLKKELSEARKK